MDGKKAEKTVLIPGFSIPSGARAVLVTAVGEGRFCVQPVGHGKSILNIHTEIFDHVNSYPHSDAWLKKLRDCISSRLDSRSTGGFVCPQEDATSWGVKS